MNEKQLTILGFRIWKFAFGVGVWLNEGTPHSVAMDARKPLQWRKWVIGFYHTHPNMMNFPSGIDIFTMFAWCNALGKSIYCLIEGYDAETMGDKKTVAIGNYQFITFPMDKREDLYLYVGHACKIGRFFFWKDM